MPLVSKNFSDIITFTRASSATYFDATGTLQTATTDAPRFDYDPSTLAARGLLIEESRTNLFTYSEEFNDSDWAKTNSSISPDVVVAPDGTTTGDKHIPDNGATIGTGASSTRVYQTINVTSGITYSFSIFAKAGEYDSLQFAAITSPSVSANFSLALGTVTSGTATITPVGNDWYRCAVSFTATSTASIQIRWSALDSVVTTGDGTSGIYIWGAQLEAGAFPTSYIPTTSATVTRAADVASVNNLSPWYNAAEGTIYSEFALTLPSSGSNQFLARFSDNGYNNSIVNNVSTTGFAALSTAAGGVFNGNAPTGVAVSANTITKFVGAYATNDLAACKDGGTVATDATATIPSGITRFDLGSDHAGVNRVKAGYLRRIAYYPVRLSNTELQNLTKQ